MMFMHYKEILHYLIATITDHMATPVVNNQQAVDGMEVKSRDMCGDGQLDQQQGWFV